jgi:RNA polymerase-binding transcription factor DksA
MMKKTSVAAKATKASDHSKSSSAKGAKKDDQLKSATTDGAESKQAHAQKAKVTLSAADRKTIISKLVALREELTGQITALKNDSLKRNDEVNPVEDGTDAYDRQFGLSLASSEQEAVSQINEALRRIYEGSYGLCDQCQGLIEKGRLEALPFVQTCIRCQSELERNNSKFRSNTATSELEQWEENRTTSGEGEEEET